MWLLTLCVLTGAAVQVNWVRMGVEGCSLQGIRSSASTAECAMSLFPRQTKPWDGPFHTLLPVTRTCQWFVKKGSKEL